MSRIPLLLLSGLLCDARLWRSQMADLADLAQITVADLTQDERIEAMARRALEAMPARFAVAGMSMGGYVAFALLRLAPERVTRLALLSTSARPDGPEQARRRRALIGLVRMGRFRGVTPRLLAELVHPSRLGDAALAEAVMTMAERVGKEAYLRQQTAIMCRPDFRPDLPGLTLPTLVAVGDADRMTPPDRSAEIANAVPGARLRVIRGLRPLGAARTAGGGHCLAAGLDKRARRHNIGRVNRIAARNRL